MFNHLDLKISLSYHDFHFFPTVAQLYSLQQRSPKNESVIDCLRKFKAPQVKAQPLVS